MNTLKILVILLITMGISACATLQSGMDRADYRRGYNSAWDYAKKDALKSDCSRYPHFANQEGKRKYAQLLRDRGESESFMQGFFSGYKDKRLDFYDLYCQDDDHKEMWPLSLK